MNRSRVGAIVLRMFYLYRGSPQRVFPIFVFVAVDIVLWGFLTRYLNSVSRADFNFVPALLGAVLAVGFPDPGHAANLHGAVRGRLDAEFPQFFRHPAARVGISCGAAGRRREHKSSQSRRHAGAGANRVRPLVFLRMVEASSVASIVDPPRSLSPPAYVPGGRCSAMTSYAVSNGYACDPRTLANPAACG